MKRIFSISFWTILDLFFINIALAISILLRFGEEFWVRFYLYQETFIYLSVSFLLFAIIFKLYKRIWRYISTVDLLLITGTITVSLFISILCLNITKGFFLPRTLIALTWFFGLTSIGGSRLLWRLYCEKRVRFIKGEERILIVGAGDAGEVISREIIRRPDLGKLIGFVDDDKEKVGKRIHNKKVLSSVEKINTIIQNDKIDTVIIAIPSARGKDIRRIVDNVKNKKVKIKTLPGLYELVDGKVSVSRIRNIRIEDLLEENRWI